MNIKISVVIIARSENKIEDNKKLCKNIKYAEAERYFQDTLIIFFTCVFSLSRLETCDLNFSTVAVDTASHRCGVADGSVTKRIHVHKLFMDHQFI